MATIKVDYENARRNAKKLRTIASDCEQTASTIKKQAGGIDVYWKGEAAGAFSARMLLWCKETTSINNDINAFAGQIEAVANEMERVEKELAEAAKKAAAAVATAATGVLGFTQNKQGGISPAPSAPVVPSPKPGGLLGDLTGVLNNSSNTAGTAAANAAADAANIGLKAISSLLGIKEK